MKKNNNFIPLTEVAKRLNIEYSDCYHRAKRRNILEKKEAIKITLGIMEENLHKITESTSKSERELKEELKVLKEKLQYVEKKLSEETKNKLHGKK